MTLTCQGQGQGHVTYACHVYVKVEIWGHQSFLTSQVKVKVNIKGHQVHFLTYLRQSRGLSAKSIFLSYLGQGMSCQGQGQRSRSSNAFGDRSVTHTRPKYPLLVCPKAIACGAGLCFSADVFFHSRDLWDAWADWHEILHDGQYWAQFYNAGPKFWGAHPKKISGAKNMQNLAWFRTTSKFSSE